MPSIYFTYDSRTAEFVETFNIPAYDVFSGKKFELESYWDQSLFERFNRAYYRGYREMRAFLEENGIAHRMTGKRPKPRAVPCRLSAPPSSAHPRTGAAGPPARRSSAISTGSTAPACLAGRGTATSPMSRSMSRSASAPTTVATVRADRLRKDLARSGTGNGYHAFEATLEAPVAEADRSLVSAVASVEGQPGSIALANRAGDPPTLEGTATVVNPPPEQQRWLNDLAAVRKAFEDTLKIAAQDIREAVRGRNLAGDGGRRRCDRLRSRASPRRSTKFVCARTS